MAVRAICLALTAALLLGTYTGSAAAARVHKHRALLSDVTELATQADAGRELLQDAPAQAEEGSSETSWNIIATWNGTEPSTWNDTGSSPSWNETYYPSPSNATWNETSSPISSNSTGNSTDEICGPAREVYLINMAGHANQSVLALTSDNDTYLNISISVWDKTLELPLPISSNNITNDTLVWIVSGPLNQTYCVNTTVNATTGAIAQICYPERNVTMGSLGSDVTLTFTIALGSSEPLIDASVTVGTLTYNMYLKVDPVKPVINQDVQIIVMPSTNTTACYEPIYDYYPSSGEEYSSSLPSSGDYDSSEQSQ